MADEEIIDKLLFELVEVSRDPVGWVYVPEFVDSLLGKHHESYAYNPDAKRIMDRINSEGIANQVAGESMEANDATHKICNDGGYIAVLNKKKKDAELYRENLRTGIRYNKTTRKTSVWAIVIASLALIVSIFKDQLVLFLSSIL